MPSRLDRPTGVTVPSGVRPGGDRLGGCPGDPRRRRWGDRQPPGQAPVRGSRRSPWRAATGSGSSGINGGGKSTLLKVLAGTVAPEAGTVRRGRETRLSVLDQDAPLPPGTVADAVGEGLGGRVDPRPARHGRLGGPRRRHAVRRAGEARGAGSRAGRRRWRRRPGRRWRPPDPRRADQPPRPRRHRVARGLAGAVPGGLVLVTHDRHVLDRVTNNVLEIDRGRAYVHVGGYQSWLDARDERAQRSEVAETKRRNLARAELAWLRRGAPARTRKPQARIDAATALGDRSPRGRRPRRRPPAARRDAPPRRPGGGAPRRRRRLRRRLAVPAPRPGPRPARAPRDRRTQRRRASRPCSTSSPAAGRRARGGWCTGPRRGSRCTTSGATRSIPISGCARRWPARTGSRTGPTPGCWRRSGSRTTPSGRRSASSRAVSDGGSSSS